MHKKADVEKYPGIAWLIATMISWISFSVASWFLADDSKPKRWCSRSCGS
jgi:hypothetical protein